MLRRLFPLLWLLLACSAGAAGLPRSLLLTREMPDLYRSEIGKFYIKTKNCGEIIYNDRVDLSLRSVQTLTFRSGRICVIDKFLKEVKGNEIDYQSPF